MRALWGMIVRLIVRPSGRSELRKMAADQQVERSRITEDLQEQYAEAVRLRMHVARQQEKETDQGFGQRLRGAE